jgi:hypothetical protein
MSESETIQQTLSGDEAQCGRVRPSTLVYCYECGTHVLRRKRSDHNIYTPRWSNRYLGGEDE